ncbi:D-alanyl-D-alanine carboxypeptidase family protein [Paenibacillus sp. GCM10027626]|uniref:D-alanyl-D-alanine carboxypeptidase family protein n=1 Tax=Paenibacillus sp. GCM10027626 TaxID=3273411 RepID=UPI0036441CCC
MSHLKELVQERQALRAGDLQSEAAVLIDDRTGQVLFKKNEQKQLYPASTTKLLTALIALEKGDPDALIIVGDEARIKSPGESTADLYSGQKLTLRDLVAGLLLPSGNDAARTIARYIARIDSGKRMPPEEGMAEFVNMMNTRAQQIGADNSHFVNPHGLPDEQHYTTAADLAQIALAARQNKLLREIVSLREYTIDTGAADEKQIWINSNKLLHPDSGFYYKGTTGMKTGYTSAAGYCLVASAERNGQELIAVVLNSTANDVWQDAIKLFDYGFTRR